MNIETVLNVLRVDEGLCRGLYFCPAGKLTCGYGHMIEDDDGLTAAQVIDMIRDGVSTEKAERWLAEDVAVATKAVRRYRWFHRHPPHTQCALVCMVFQLGATSFSGFKKARRALSVGDLDTAAREFLDSKWARDDSPARARRMIKWMQHGALPQRHYRRRPAEIARIA
ncbi:MAG: glycoside hydrolase family protein [Pseudomonadota bacterium]